MMSFFSSTVSLRVSIRYELRPCDMDLGVGDRLSRADMRRCINATGEWMRTMWAHGRVCLRPWRGLLPPRRGARQQGWSLAAGRAKQKRAAVMGGSAWGELL
jgi:hypothetical protein